MFDWVKRQIGKMIDKEKQPSSRVQDTYMYETFYDPVARRYRDISNVQKVIRDDGSEYTCYRQRNGVTYDVYSASVNAYNSSNDTIMIDNYRNVYFQIPKGRTVDKNLLYVVAMEADKPKDDKSCYDIARNVGIFECDLNGKWYSDGRKFQDVDKDLVEPRNREYNRAKEEERARRKAAEENRRILEANQQMLEHIQQSNSYQKDRPQNLSNRYFDKEGIFPNGAYYKGIVCANPNWKYGDQRDAITGTEFGFRGVSVQYKGGYYIYQGEVLIDPHYYINRDMQTSKFITFKSNVDIDSCTSSGGIKIGDMTHYPPNQAGAEAMLKLLSQPSIYSAKTPQTMDIGGIYLTRDGRYSVETIADKDYQDPQY